MYTHCHIYETGYPLLSLSLINLPHLLQNIASSLFTSDKGGGICFLPCLFVRLLSRLLKNESMDLGESCVSRDVTWTNWLTFEPDPDHSPDAGTRLLSPISYKRCYEEFYIRKIPLVVRHTLWFAKKIHYTKHYFTFNQKLYQILAYVN